MKHSILCGLALTVATSLGCHKDKAPPATDKEAANKVAAPAPAPTPNEAVAKPEPPVPAGAPASVTLAKLEKRGGDQYAIWTLKNDGKLPIATISAQETAVIKGKDYPLSMRVLNLAKFNDGKSLAPGQSVDVPVKMMSTVQSGDTVKSQIRSATFDDGSEWKAEAE
jgi:hypothetical protein